ncbi:hypothetical protein KSP40_PGU006753 [Platanthera guangdongensis]|uniref:Target of Myb protein 1 n=1 Tax=Platanthera guangdongensis TaxID=2320717 RepID=A0ABR2LU07_9ASPA
MVPSIQSIFSMPSSATWRVEKATSRLLLSPDLMMNLDICNSINSDPWKAKAFVKAVKMRLQNRDSNVQHLALTLLDTMITKCDDFVHFQVVERRILPEMAKILRKSKNMQVRRKVLALLESWQEAFHGPDGRYPQFYDTYTELKRSGVQFPENQKNADLKSTPTMPKTNQLQIGYKIPSDTSGRLDDIMVSANFHFSLSDLDNIRSVMDLFANMLKAVNPNDHKAMRDEVITDLSNQCNINQKMLVRLINSTENDRVLDEALSLNDNLQVVLSKHGALVAGSSLPPETAIKQSKPDPPPPLVPEAGHQFHHKEEDEEGDDDGFTIIAKRNSIYKSTELQDVSQKSTKQSNAMILFEPKPPASSSKKEEDMIDLLSLTLPPTTSQSPPWSFSNQNQYPISGSPSWEHYLNHPPPLPPNQDYNSYSSYIAPWARPAAISPISSRQPSPHYSYSSYLPPSLPSTEGTSNPFL